MIFEFSRFTLPPVENKLIGPAYERMKKSLLALIIRQRIEVFDAEGGGSGHWKALSPATIEMRRQGDDKGAAKLRARGIDAGGIKILQDSGVLRSSFTGKAWGARGAEGLSHHDEEISQDEVAISTNVEYAKIQNDGGTIKNGFGKGIEIVIPPRPFDEFSESDREEIGELLEHYLNG